MTGMPATHQPTASLPRTGLQPGERPVALARTLLGGLPDARLMAQYNEVMRQARRKDWFRWFRQSLTRLRFPALSGWAAEDREELRARTEAILFGDPGFVLSVIKTIQEAIHGQRASQSLYWMVCIAAGMRALGELFQARQEALGQVLGNPALAAAIAPAPTKEADNAKQDG